MSIQSEQYPGLSARLLAHNIDLVILLPFFYLIGYFIRDNYLLIGLCFALYVLYHSLFEATVWRGTPGKKLQKMKVQHESGEAPVIHLVFLRNVLKLVSVIPLFVGIVMISWDPRHRALHDRLTNSIVTF